LLLGLSHQQQPAITQLYLRLLNDDWFVEGADQSGYPLRFAAAWGLVAQISGWPDLREQIDPAVFVEGASHTDARLAGSCLMALGMFGDKAYEQLIAVGASTAFTPERALIVATALPEDAAAARKVIENALPAQSPQGRFWEWAEQNATASPADAGRFLSENADVAVWMDGIQSNHDIFPELRFALKQKFATLFGDQLKSDDLFQRHRPKSIPILTMRSMFGGE